MPVPLYMDVNVPQSITDQLRQRGVDVVTAIEDGARELADYELLQRAGGLGRAVFTHDARFKALAEDWQRQGRPFAGLLFGRQLGGTIGQFVRDLELIARACEPNDCRNTVQYLPL
jgi:hypothetical protein